MSEMWENILDESLTGRGVKLMSAKSVEELLAFIKDRPIVLVRFEAKRIEPVWDRDMPEYSMYGMFPKINDDWSAAHRKMVVKFQELSQLAATKEYYAMRYDVWLSVY